MTAHSGTARRTGATLLYLSGVPTRRQCMMLTGHTPVDFPAVGGVELFYKTLSARVPIWVAVLGSRLNNSLVKAIVFQVTTASVLFY